jgi:hypothetical protein
VSSHAALADAAATSVIFSGKDAECLKQLTKGTIETTQSQGICINQVRYLVHGELVKTVEIATLNTGAACYRTPPPKDVKCLSKPTLRKTYLCV